jgi:metal transporter CNNM
MGLLYPLVSAWSAAANFTVQHSHPHPGLTEDEWTLYLAISVALVLLAGLMSGLTLGLMSMNVLDMEASRRCLERTCACM